MGKKMEDVSRELRLLQFGVTLAVAFPYRMGNEFSS